MTLAGPRPRVAPVSIPGDWTVWTFSDAHGALWAMGLALQEAGLIDSSLRWCARPKTALVGLGDYIDRGQASTGLIALLERLRREAPASGGLVVLCEGNHEEMARLGLGGDDKMRDIWLSNGGLAALNSLGLSPESRSLRRDGRALSLAVRSKAPGFIPFLGSLAPWARWRDIALVHAGLEAHADLRGFTAGSNRLWVREEFYGGRPMHADITEPVYAAYHAAGIKRAVIGHTPVRSPQLVQGGRILMIDTNACANPAWPEQAARLTLAKLPRSGTLNDTRFVEMPTAGAPDRMAARAGS